MITRIIETGTHVFECTTRKVTGPDARGRCHYQTRIEQLSGHELTPKQWQRMVRRLRQVIAQAGGSDITEDLK